MEAESPKRSPKKESPILENKKPGRPRTKPDLPGLLRKPDNNGLTRFITLNKINKSFGNHEREFPIPGIPGNIGLQFPSRKSGMEFSTPNPVPENGNGIFHSHSRSRKWEWNFMEFSFPFPFPKMGMEFAISRSRSRSPKVIPAHPWHQ